MVCPWCAHGTCYNFLYSLFQGRAFGTPAPSRWPGRKQGREDIERECVTETGTIARTTAGERWASWPIPGPAAMPRPLGRKP